MGRVEDDTSNYYEHVNAQEPIDAEVVPVASSVVSSLSSSSCQALTRNLVRKDTYYQDEPDIVAVFDLDSDLIAKYQRITATNLTVCTVFMFGLVGLYKFLDLFPAAIFFLILAFVYVILSARAWAKVRAASSSLLGGGIHLAITSSSVRYDQEDPMVSTEISVRNISSCTIAERRVRLVWCRPPTKINLVQMQIVGSNVPKVYVGVEDPKNFARIVMTLKNRELASSGQVRHSRQGNEIV